MIALDTLTRQLIVETGLVAVNHGFYPQAKTVLEALPWLTKNEQARNIISAVLCIGLSNSADATLLLKDDMSKEAALIRQLLASKRH